MLLRNTEYFRDVLELSGSKREYRRVTLEEGQVVKTNGFFVERDREIFGLCADNGSLWLVCRGAVLECTEGVCTEVEFNSESERTFVIRQNGIEVIRLTYKPEKPC